MSWCREVRTTLGGTHHSIKVNWPGYSRSILLENGKKLEEDFGGVTKY